MRLLIARKLLCTFALALMTFSVPAFTAEFRWENWDADWLNGTLRMRGEIELGDHKKLLAALGDRFGYGKGSHLYLDLDSEGGNFEEAIRIAEISREKNLSTAISANNKCLSACAVVFMSGWSNNNSYYFKSRTMHPTAVLGFHAPIVEAVGGNFDAADLDDAHSRAIEQFGKKLMKVARTRLESWTAPLIKPGLINEMMLVRGSDHFYYIDTVGKAAEFEIDLDKNTDGPKSKTKENFRNACWNAIARTADSAVADAAWEDWLGNPPVRDFEIQTNSDGTRVYSTSLNRAKGRFCDVGLNSRDEFRADGSETTTVTVGVGGAENLIDAPVWFFWSKEHKLRDLPIK